MKRINIIFICLFLLVFYFPSTLIGQIKQTTLRSPMPTSRMATASAVVEDNIYIFGGGVSGGKFISTVQKYDPSSDKWTEMTPMLTARGSMPAVAIGKMVYVLGGRTDTGVTDIVEVYDTVSNSWKTIKSMPSAIWNHMAIAIGKKIYVFGGITGTGDRRKSIDKVEIYDSATGSWTKGSPMPEPRQGAAVAVVSGKIYLIGGKVGAGAQGMTTDTVQVYDTVTNTWSIAKPMQMTKTGAQATVVDGKIYVVGGQRENKIMDTIEVYNPATNTWEIIKFSLQKPRSGHCTVSIGNKIYIIGGLIEPSMSGIVSTVEEIEPVQ